MTYHAPVEVVLIVDILKGAKSGIEGAVAVAHVAGLKLDLVDGDVAAILSSLVDLVLGYGLNDDLEVRQLEGFKLGIQVHLNIRDNWLTSRLSFIWIICYFCLIPLKLGINRGS